MDRKQDQATSLDRCLTEIRKADESIRTTTRRLDRLRRVRAYALDDNEQDRLNA